LIHKSARVQSGACLAGLTGLIDLDAFHPTARRSFLEDVAAEIVEFSAHALAVIAESSAEILIGIAHADGAR